MLGLCNSVGNDGISNSTHGFGGDFDASGNHRDGSIGNCDNSTTRQASHRH